MEGSRPEEASGRTAKQGAWSAAASIGNGVFELRFSDQASAAIAARDARGRRFEVEVRQLGPHWRTFNRLTHDFPDDELHRYTSRMTRIAEANGGAFVAYTPDPLAGRPTAGLQDKAGTPV